MTAVRCHFRGLGVKIASSLYRLLGQRISNGYESAKSRHIFRDLIDATAQVVITDRDIEVRFQKRAHNPLLRVASPGVRSRNPRGNPG